MPVQCLFNACISWARAPLSRHHLEFSTVASGPSGLPEHRRRIPPYTFGPTMTTIMVWIGTHPPDLSSTTRPSEPGATWSDLELPWSGAGVR